MKEFTKKQLWGLVLFALGLILVGVKIKLLLFVAGIFLLITGYHLMKGSL